MTLLARPRVTGRPGRLSTSTSTTQPPAPFPAFIKCINAKGGGVFLRLFFFALPSARLVLGQLLLRVSAGGFRDSEERGHCRLERGRGPLLVPLQTSGCLLSLSLSFLVQPDCPSVLQVGRKKGGFSPPPPYYRVAFCLPSGERNVGVN